jgi:predicted amidophosphoribosyltransferase
MLTELVDVTFPTTCLACGEWPKPLCNVCVPEFGVHADADGLLYAAQLEERLSSILAAIKDKNRVALMRPLAMGLKPVLTSAIERFSPTVIVCPPSSRRNFRKRGFNPALRLFKAANPSSLQVSDRMLRMRSQPKDQRGLSQSQRMENLRGVFVARQSEHRVLLVDDVATTGATLLAATEALELSGAQVVGSCVLARRFPKSTHSDSN